MNISFKSKKLEKTFNEGAQLRKRYGADQAKKIGLRMSALRAAERLGDFMAYSKPERCHELSGDRAGQLSMDLIHPYRLIFIPNHDPIPKKDDGGLDWSRVTAVKIIDVENTHG